MSVTHYLTSSLIALSLGLILYGSSNMFHIEPITIIDGKQVTEVMGIFPWSQPPRLDPKFGGEHEEDTNIGINTENKDESNTSNEGIQITSNGAEYVVITFVGIAIYTVALMYIALGYRRDRNHSGELAENEKARRYEEREGLLKKLEEAINKLGEN